MQKARRAARELALNILYQVDAAWIPVEEAIETARENVAADAEVFDFAEMIVRGVASEVSDIDKYIGRLSVGWPLARQPVVDRNVLRMAIYEMTRVEATPLIVVVNEAVEIAKKFSTEDSGKFVNGVLAAYMRELPERKPAEETS